MNTDDTLSPKDQDRLTLLDRIAERVPELALEEQRIEWKTLEDGAEALLVNGGGIDGGDGVMFANAPCGDDLHAVGTLGQAVGCIFIRADGVRILARTMRDLLADRPNRPGQGRALRRRRNPRTYGRR